jgi:hypothetical protein
MRRLKCIVWRLKNQKSEAKFPDRLVPRIPVLDDTAKLLYALKSRVKHYTESRKKRLRTQMKLTQHFKGEYKEVAAALEVRGSFMILFLISCIIFNCNLVGIFKSSYTKY